MSTIPTIGRIVHYTLSEADAQAINRRRDDAITHRHSPYGADVKLKPTGEQVHTGNKATEGDVYPMIIVRVWSAVEGGSVNGQVLLDGNDALWVTSVSEGEGPRRFAWPVIPAQPKRDPEPAAGESKDLERAWRKAIADQVRRNCTPSDEAYKRGGDIMIREIADWIENPPHWSAFEAPAR